MSPDSIQIADTYWANDFGCERASLRPKGPRVQCHCGGLSDYSGVFVLVLGSAPVVSLPPSLFAALLPLADKFVISAIRDPAVFRRLLLPAVATRLIGPALLQYADRSTFTLPTTPGARALTLEDATQFHALQAACSADDWGQKALSLTGGPIFGAFSGDGSLKAIAGIDVWAERIAHLSVITHPDARGLGYGTRVVALASDQALRAGLLPQYRVLEENEPSRRIATKLGFQPYGWTLAARLAHAEVS